MNEEYYPEDEYVDDEDEDQDDDSLESRKANIQEYYKARREGDRTARGMWQRNRNLQKNISRNIKNKAGMDDSGHKYTKSDFAFMLVIAGIFDLLSLVINIIPYIGGVISTVFILPIGMFTLYLLYTKRGISISFGKKGSALKFGGTALIEAIPVLNIAPGFILNVILNYPLPKKIV
jgi:hypothetical protein